MPQLEQDYLSVREFANRLHVTARMVQNMLRRGEITGAVRLARGEAVSFGSRFRPSIICSPTSRLRCTGTMSKRSSIAPRFADLPDVMHVDELAALLGLSRTTCYEYCRRGLFPFPVIRCGRRLFVSKAAVIRAFERGQTL